MDELEANLEAGGAAAVEFAASALAERGGKTLPCANCAEPLIGPFCAVCGQPRDTHRRSVKVLLHDFFQDIASFDSRILRTARALLVQPGKLPKAFREGRTQRYVPAVRLYLFVSLLFFLFLSATGIAIVQFDTTVSSIRFVTDKTGNVIEIVNGVRTPTAEFKADAKGNVYLANGAAPHIALPKMKADGSVNNNITNTARYFQRIGSGHTHLTPAMKALLAKIEAESLAEAKKSKYGWWETHIYTAQHRIVNDPAALNGPLTSWIPRILFLLLPLFALLLAALYRQKRKEFYFVDHLVFSFTMHTFFFVTLIVAAIAAQFIAGTWVAGFVVIAMGLYLLLSLKRFYGQSWSRTGLKFAGIAAIYVLFILMPALFAAIIVSIVAA